MLKVRVDHPFTNDNDITIYSLHLNPSDEEKRLLELKNFQNHISAHGTQIVMGDFNAICADGTDYSLEYMSKISAVREQNNKELPRGDVYKWMQDSQYKDVFRECNPNDQDAYISTCRFATRIDYIWQKGELKDDWRLSSSRIINCGKVRLVTKLTIGH